MNQTHPTSEQLVEYLHGELPAAQDAAIHAHLAGCTACAESYEGEASLRELLRAHARTEERDLPDGVAAAIRDAVAKPPRASTLERLRDAFRPVLMIPAAAALAAALYVGITSWHRSAGTSIDAAYYVDTHAALTASTPFSEDAPLPAMLTSDDETH